MVHKNYFKHKAWALKQGVCTRCLKEDSEPNTTHCTACLNYFASRYTPKRNGIGRPITRRRAA